MAQGRFLPDNVTANTTGSGFLSITDITDSIAIDFVTANDPRVTLWLEQVDGEILSLAQEKDVSLESIVMPLHKKILEYCKCYYCVVCFQDCFGRNDVSQSSQETIKLKLDFYMQRCAILRLQLTAEMFTQSCSTLSANQRASGTISVYRA